MDPWGIALFLRPCTVSVSLSSSNFRLTVGEIVAPGDSFGPKTFSRRNLKDEMNPNRGFRFIYHMEIHSIKGIGPLLSPTDMDHLVCEDSSNEGYP